MVANICLGSSLLCSVSKAGVKPLDNAYPSERAGYLPAGQVAGSKTADTILTGIAHVAIPSMPPGRERRVWQPFQGSNDDHGRRPQAVSI